MLIQIYEVPLQMAQIGFAKAGLFFGWCAVTNLSYGFCAIAVMHNDSAGIVFDNFCFSGCAAEFEVAAQLLNLLGVW